MIEAKILQYYHQPGHPIAYAGINKIYEYFNKKIPKKTIQETLKKSYAYTIHKETKKSRRNPYYIYYKRQQFQIDLIDIQSISKQNGGVKFLLTCIDVFTKKAFVRACKNKTAPEILKQFKSILIEAKKKPRTLLSDKGSEIKNKMFNGFCKDNNIKQIFPENEIHAAVVERFNKTFQIILYKYLSQNNTLRYVDRLYDFMDSYNRRYHRSIKMTPNEGELSENHPKIFMEVNEKIMKLKRQNRKPKFKINDEVRIKPSRFKFRRAYNKQFLEEIFKVSRINDNMDVIMYELKDLLDEPIIGAFYKDELSAVLDQNIYKIDKVIKRKKINGQPMALVSWIGYGPKFNQWIPEDDVIDLR
jgi:hypothetical protein